MALSTGSVRAASPEEDAALALPKAGQYEHAAAAFGKIATEYAAKSHRTDKQWYFCPTDGQQAIVYQAIVYSVLGADKKVAITVLRPD